MRPFPGNYEPRARAVRLDREPPAPLPDALAAFDPYQDEELIKSLEYTLQRGLEPGLEETNDVLPLIYFSGIRQLADNPRWSALQVSDFIDVLRRKIRPDTSDNLTVIDLPAMMLIAPDITLQAGSDPAMVEALRTECDDRVSWVQKMKLAVRLDQLGQLDSVRRAAVVARYHNWPTYDHDSIANQGQEESEELVLLKMLDEDAFRAAAARYFARLDLQDFLHNTTPYQRPKFVYNLLLMQRELSWKDGRLQVGDRIAPKAATGGFELPARPPL